MNQLKHDYELAAKSLLEWVQSTIERFASENLGSTLEEALAVTDRLRSFLLHEKPQRTADKLDLESKFAEIQQTLLVHDRPAYECPQEFAPDTIDAAFDALWQVTSRRNDNGPSGGGHEVCGTVADELALEFSLCDSVCLPSVSVSAG